jgi:hypothetical protein
MPDKLLTLTGKYKLIGECVIIKAVSYRIQRIDDVNGDTYRITFYNSDLSLELDREIDYHWGVIPCVKMRCGRIGSFSHVYCTLEHLQTIPEFVRRINNAF